MAERFHRAQLLLEPKQYKRLSFLAQQQGSSISELTREVIHLGLKFFHLKKKRKIEALERLTQIRKSFAQKHGVYSGDPAAEVRVEREEQLNRLTKK